MKARACLGIHCFVIGCLLATASNADPQVPPAVPPAAFPDGIHTDLAKRVAASEAGAYAVILKEFDRYLSAHPDDAVAAVEKCRFISTFTDSDEGAYVESAERDFESCTTDLDDVAIAGSETVKLFQAERKWGDRGAADGEALLKQADAEHWTAAHRAALHEHLHAIYQFIDKQKLKAGAHALAAVELMPTSSLRLPAAEYLAQTGARTRAVALLQPSDAVKWSGWQLEKVAKLLVDAGAAPLAREVIEKQGTDKLTLRTRVILARLLAEAGEVRAARELLAKATDAPDAGAASAVGVLKDRFRLERDFGDRNAAAAAYRDLRRKGWSADPVARDRLGLFFAYPGVPFTVGDLPGLVALAASLGFCALIPLLIVAPIHYRSLVKQSRGVPLQPPAPWGLGHLWYALAAMLIAGLLAVYLFDYRLIEAAIARGSNALGASSDVGSSVDLGRALVFQTALMVVGLVPLFVNPVQRQMLRGRWSVAKSICAGAGCSIAFLVAVGLVTMVFQRFRTSATTGALGSMTTQSLQGIQAQYGLLALVAVVCFAVPLVEEVIFRGVFLQAAGRRLAFWAAVVLQAVVFAALHEEPGALPAIFALALLTAWLARRSEGLLASILCHGTNNAVALIALTRLTSTLNGTS